MYLKLALRNIRRSVRDYAIYFITLLFGVAVFYAFNSIGSQQILFDMESSASASVFESTTQLLGMFSVVVACVLGFLILYANQFLIRRRKREFGTYLVLGMTSRASCYTRRCWWASSPWPRAWSSACCCPRRCRSSPRRCSAPP